MTTVRVNRKGADRARSGHPWIFSSDILDRGEAAPGEAVQVVDPRGQLLGTAFFSSTSQITLRLLARSALPIDRTLIATRLRQALAFRQEHVTGTNAYRLVHGEGDLLPGLVVDRYGDYLVIQLLSQGIDRLSQEIVDALVDLLSPKGIVARNDVPVRKHEGLPLETKVIWGDIPPEVAIEMNGFKWSADLMHGQKTGVFLDQRENYEAVGARAHGRGLDCFTSTGGFAIHMSKRCESVEAVDSSAGALRTAQSNAEANGATNINWVEADVFDVLTSYASAHRRFNTVVLDPPAFTKSRSAIEGAARGYKEINHRALRLMEPGGLFVSCSCSHHFSEAMLLEVIAQASLDAGRTLRILERRTQSADHPILLTVPETHYLKCLVFEVV